MALRHMPLIAEKASNPCRPGQEANRVSSLSPTQVRMSDHKANSWRYLGRGASGCHLTLECTGISPTPGDTQPGSEIPEAPWELENGMEPELVRVRAGVGEKKPEWEPGLRTAGEQGYPAKSRGASVWVWERTEPDAESIGSQSPPQIFQKEVRADSLIGSGKGKVHCSH